MVSIIAAPETAPQTAATQPVVPPRVQPRLDRLDERLIEVVRQEGVIPLWGLLNMVASEETNDRNTAREVRLGLWQRVRRFVRLRLLWRHGSKAIGIKPPPAASPRMMRRSRATVRTRLGKRAVSTPMEQTRSDDEDRPKQVADEGTRPNSSSLVEATGAAQAKIAQRRSNISSRVRKQIRELMLPDVVSASARAMARLPRRQRRRWTGWLNEGWHGYRDQPVVLPSGQSAYLFGSLRGRAVVTLDRGRLLGGYFGDGLLRWAVIPAAEVRPLKNPHAVLLGQAKLGVREKRSLKKQLACRRNGYRPCRPGKRRGRPRRQPGPNENVIDATQCQ